MQKRAPGAKNSEICTEDGAERPLAANECNGVLVTFYWLTIFICLGMGSKTPYLLCEHPGGGEGYVFSLSAINFQLVNGWAEGVGRLRRNGIRRQSVFCGMHVYILRVLGVIQCNWRARKLRPGQTCGK
jgi:hypothetical protein